MSHRDSHTDPQPIEPGKPYKIEFDLLACAYKFAKGHRLRIAVAPADFLNVWPTPKPCTNTVYRNAVMPSHVILPVAPAQNPPLPAPALKASIDPPPTREQLGPPEVEIYRDLINDTATIRYATNYGAHRPHTASYTVSTRDPATASVRADAQCRFDYEDRKIVVDAQTATSSDAQTFHHTVDLEGHRERQTALSKKLVYIRPSAMLVARNARR